MSQSFDIATLIDLARPDESLVAVKRASEQFLLPVDIDMFFRQLLDEESTPAEIMTKLLGFVRR